MVSSRGTALFCSALISSFLDARISARQGALIAAVGPSFALSSRGASDSPSY